MVLYIVIKICRKELHLVSKVVSTVCVKYLFIFLHSLSISIYNMVFEQQCSKRHGQIISDVNTLKMQISAAIWERFDKVDKVHLCLCTFL